MQICIDPPNPRYQGLGGVDANLHRGAWGGPNLPTPPTLGIRGLGGSMQICMTPPTLGIRGLGGSMQICIDPPNPRYQGLGGVDANLHRPPQP